MGNKIYYKYLDIEGGKKSLSNLTLKYSSPKSVNDPTEFYVSGFHDITESEKPRIINYWRRKYGYEYTGFTFSDNINSKDNLKEELLAINEKISKYYYFLSLSRLNNSLSMWYHYANKHTGIVIGYAEESFPQLYNVKYVKEPPKIRHNCVLDDDARFKQLIDILTTKSDAWSYEQEVRDILYMDKENTKLLYFEKGIVPIEAHFIKEICFGMKCTNKTKQQIRNICQQRHIQCSFLEAKLDYSSYLSIQPIK